MFRFDERLKVYAPGRGAVHAEKLYSSIRPGTTLITDRYKVYNGIAKVGRRERRRQSVLADRDAKANDIKPYRDLVALFKKLPLA